MTQINIQNQQGYDVDKSYLRQAIQTVINRHEVNPEIGISVVLTTDVEVQTLNKQHRHVDAPTDVLSFPSEPLPAELASLEPPYLGDLIIAYPYASRQAERLNHDLKQSLALLAVHGTLHLLGYDHDTPENHAEMWAEQAAILEILGIDSHIVPFLEGSDHV